MKTMLSLTLALIASVSVVDQLNADIVVVAPTSSNAGSFQITTDITFNIHTAGFAQAFIFDEWVNSDGSQTSTPYSPSLSISINGNLPQFYPGYLVDNYNDFTGQVSPNDGFLVTQSSFRFWVDVGDTVTLKSGIFSLDPVLRFNPQATQTFSGNMFVTDTWAVQLSNTVAIPEPSFVFLALTAGIAGLFLRRP